MKNSQPTDKEYKKMLAGELYRADRIKPENRSIHGKIIAQK
ncbi:hypothetical protein KIM322_12010 [Lactobacillus xylocopicola]|uniref:Maltose O-acetyltransferase n=1 Tax=Lactobacillus xylocopicola TaxID=2976676 RepID=A0ABM8BIK8_9LACO|nr:hypothetical protein KIM322_12010 [Lactobacillus xylocopicola]